MKIANTAEALFSLKTFVAAMLALFLAESIGLPRPFWALTTAYVVSNPLAGAVRSKAIYRIVGTFFGSAIAVLLVPRFSNAPEFLSLALAVWVGLCLFVSLLDRTPRSYMFILSGYTMALIGFPSVANPGAIFDIAVARVEEITLGIVCMTLIHSLVFPHSLGPVLLLRMDKAIRDARQWSRDALSAGTAEHNRRDRSKLAVDITELRLMTTHLPFDTSNLRWTSRVIRTLQDRLSAMVPLLSAIEDRLQTLCCIEGKSLSPLWRKVMNDIADWVESGASAAPERAAQLQQTLAELEPKIHRNASWSELLKVDLVKRLAMLVDTWEACTKLRRHIEAGLRDDHPAQSQHYAGEKPHVLHRDYQLALMSSFAAIAAIVICCALWIFTGWSLGAGAAMMAAVLSCLYATQDDPVTSMKSFLTYQMWSVPLAALYILVILPAVHTFATLVLVLIPLFLPLGVFLARPATVGRGMALLFGFAGALGMQDTGNADLVSFINSMMAQLSGMAIAVLSTRLLRTVDAGWTARRLLHAGWKELAAMHTVEKIPTVGLMSARMLDRVALLTPRLALAGPREDLVAVDALADLRIGLNMSQLLRAQQKLSSDGIRLQMLFQDLSTHFRNRPQHNGPPDALLLKSLDASLNGVCAAPISVEQSNAVSALVGIRRDLFPEAASFQAANEFTYQAVEKI